MPTKLMLQYCAFFWNLYYVSFCWTWFRVTELKH